MHEDQEANVTLRFNAIESSATGVDIMIIDYTTLPPPPHLHKQVGYWDLQRIAKEKAEVCGTSR